jgi:hypothetical protein
MGIAFAGTIDKIGDDPETGETVLVMVEPRRWDGSDKRGYEVQEKFNTYLGFALDGELQAAFPMLASKPIRIQIDCADRPDASTIHLLKLIEQQINFQGIKLGVRIIPDLAERMKAIPVSVADLQEGFGIGKGAAGGCGSGGCGCH